MKIPVLKFKSQQMQVEGCLKTEILLKYYIYISTFKVSSRVSN